MKKPRTRAVSVGPFASVSGFTGQAREVAALSVPSSPHWAGPRLAALPVRWADKMAAEWNRLALELAAREKTHGLADMWLMRRLSELEEGRRAGIKPAMGDFDLCKLAKEEARDHADRQAEIAGDWRAKSQDIPADMLEAAMLSEQCADALGVMAGRGLADLWPDGPDMTDRGRLARLRDPAFWRRVFRKVHARTVEGCAIRLGLVNGRADPYVSRESLDIATKRQAANRAMLAHTLAVSENGDEMTLLEVAKRSVSNPTIRRGELMTRVSGFELVADKLGHVKRWAVLTLPSRYHKWSHTKNGHAIENKKYDGTQPREAQQVLAAQWRKLCAWWERQGLRVYGFRTTEPHQDGTPHWNVLCFFAPLTERVFLKKQCRIPVDAIAVFDEGLRAYFLDHDHPNEPGAQAHRVKVEAIDSSKGSAAAYIAKYIAKGVDGFGLDVDLFGNNIERTSRAVVAWSRVWGIRQFQQIGGPPVTVWRELRRLNPDNLGDGATVADTLREAAHAVNLKLHEPDEKRAVAWQRYTEVQGGPTCKRKAWRVRMLMEQRERANRYGEVSQPRMVGVVGLGRVDAPAPSHLLAMGVAGAGYYRPALTAIQSERCEWVTVGKGSADDAIEAHCERLQGLIHAMDAQMAVDMALRIDRLQKRREDEARLREALPPWTRVNNCTATPTLDTLDRSQLDVSRGQFAPLKRLRKKLGRRYLWKQGAGGSLEGVGDEGCFQTA